MSIEAHRFVLSELYLPIPSVKFLLSTYGYGADEILEKLSIPSRCRVDFLVRMNVEEIRQIWRAAKCYYGALNMLNSLYEDGILFGVYSFCSPGYMNIFLSRFELQNIKTYKHNESFGNEKASMLHDLLKSSPDRLSQYTFAPQIDLYHISRFNRTGFSYG